MPIRSAAVALTLATGLAACATPTPYQPITPGKTPSGGYSELRVEPNRFRVSFAGNTVTSRQAVEGYLLYRAAELTVQAGYDWFTMIDRNTDRDVRTYVDPWLGYGGFGYGPWGGRRWYGGYGWGGWGGYGGWDVRTVDRFEAAAEIVMGRGAKPADDLRAFEARAVIENLRPHVQLPAPAG